jgi:putative peptidoglycan lipid II flippase
VTAEEVAISNAPKPEKAGEAASTREGRKLRRSSASLAVISVLNMVTGFSWDVAIAAKFGISARSDAFYVAWTLPAMLTSIAYLSCNAVMVPMLARDLVSTTNEQATKRFSILLNFIIGLAMAIGLAGALTAPLLISALAPGLSHASHHTAIDLARIMFLVLPIGIGFEVVRTGLYAYERYSIPTALEMVGNLIITGSIVALGGSLGIIAAAWGLLFARGVQILVIVPMLLSQRTFRYHRSLNLRFPGVKEALFAFLSPLSGVSMRRATVIVEKMLASSLPAGSITALDYGSKLGLSLATAFYSSVTTALLTRLSAQLKVGARELAIVNIATSIKLVTFLAIPGFLLIFVMRDPLTAALIGWGRVTDNAIALTASVMAVYSISLLLMGPWRIAQNFFYAEARPHVVTSLFVFTAIVNVTFDVALLQIWGAQGIAAATAISTAAATAVAFYLMQRSIHFPWATLLPFGGAMAAATGTATLGLLICINLNIIDADGDAHFLRNAVSLVEAGVIVALPFIAILLAENGKHTLRQRTRKSAALAVSIGENK